jgi:hypothetical protein
MSKEEKVNCMRQIDLCYEKIKQLEKTLETCDKYISQGTTGIILGILSLIFGFFVKICFFGLVFGVAGFLLWILNSITKHKSQAELIATKSILNQWKERLYSLDS